MTSQTMTASPETDRLEEGFDWWMLWRRKSLIALGVATALIIGSIYYARATPVYESSARLLLVKKRPEAAGIGGKDAVMSYVEDYLTAHVALLQSPLVVQQAVAHDQLQGLKSLAGSSNPSGQILSSLDVSAEGQDASTNLVDLSFAAADPDDCRVVLGSVIASYQRFLDDTFENANQDTLQVIAAQAQELKVELQTMEDQYHRLQKEAPMLWKSSKDQSFYDARLAAIEEARSSLQIRRTQLEPRVELLKEGLASPQDRSRLLVAIDQWERSERPDGERQNIDDDLMPLLVEENALRQQFGGGHPTVRAIRNQIDFIRSSRASRAAALSQGDSSQRIYDYLQEMDQQLQEIAKTELALQELFKKEHQQAKSLLDHELKERQLASEIARTEQFYEGLLTQLQGLDLGQDFGGFSATTIVPPESGRRIAPVAASVFPLSLLLGLAGGMGLAYVAERADKKYRSPDELRQQLGVPVMGCVPSIRGPATTDGMASPFAPQLCAFHRPRSSEAEAYRGIRTAIYFGAGGNGKGPCTIQITSPTAGDGKSTTAANLAISVAQSGKTCLLIDADLRRPQIHSLFSAPVERGLATIMAQESEVDDAIVDSGIVGLWLLPSGPIPPNPSELLTSPRLGELLETLRQRYDMIIIDSPPMLAVTDPSMVATLADGVVLTVRLAKNRRPEVERSLEILQGLDARVLGVVANAADGFRGQSPYAYGTYHYGYHSAEEAEPDQPLRRAVALPSPLEEPRHNGVKT